MGDDQYGTNVRSASLTSAVIAADTADSMKSSFLTLPSGDAVTTRIASDSSGERCRARHTAGSAVEKETPMLTISFWVFHCILGTRLVQSCPATESKTPTDPGKLPSVLMVL